MFGEFDIDGDESSAENVCITRIPMRIFDALKNGKYRIVKGKNEKLSIIDKTGQEVAVLMHHQSMKKIDESKKEIVIEQVSDDSFVHKYSIVSDALFQVGTESPLSNKFVKEKPVRKTILGINKKPIEQKEPMPSFLKNPNLDPNKCERYLEAIRENVQEAQRIVDEQTLEIHRQLAKPEGEINNEALKDAFNAIEAAQKTIDAESFREKELRETIDKFLKRKNRI